MLPPPGAHAGRPRRRRTGRGRDHPAKRSLSGRRRYQQGRGTGAALTRRAVCRSLQGTTAPASAGDGLAGLRRGVGAIADAIADAIIAQRRRHHRAAETRAPWSVRAYGHGTRIGRRCVRDDEMLPTRPAEDAPHEKQETPVAAVRHAGCGRDCVARVGVERLGVLAEGPGRRILAHNPARRVGLAWLVSSLLPMERAGRLKRVAARATASVGRPPLPSRQVMHHQSAWGTPLIERCSVMELYHKIDRKSIAY